MCRHRGNRVVRCDDGNAKRFMCAYHGWTYRNDGSLETLRGESEAYYDALDKTSLALIEARVETYAGIVRLGGGMRALGPIKWLEPANRTTMADNCSDNYHVPTSHLSSAAVQSRFPGRPRLSHEDQFNSPNKHVFVNGHAPTFRDADDNIPRYVHGITGDLRRPSRHNNRRGWN